MADVPLDRVWTLFVLARRDQNYEQGVRAVLRIATPRQLWEAWDEGLDTIVKLLLANARVVAAGAHGINDCTHISMHVCVLFPLH